MKLIKYIPNTITSLNLASGCFSIIYAFQNDFRNAALFILLAAIFDFFDGFAARGFHAFSKIGKDLDSLADDISFGLAPGIILYNFILQMCDISNISPNWAYTAIFIPIFSALRLAKFNVDERQHLSFIGLPTPANALLVGFFISEFGENLLNSSTNPFFVIIPMLFFGLLMVSEIPMFALKFTNFKIKDNLDKYIFLIGAIIIIAIFNLLGIAYSILWYIFLSLLYDILEKKKN